MPGTSVDGAGGAQPGKGPSGQAARAAAAAKTAKGVQEQASVAVKIQHRLGKFFWEKKKEIQTRAAPNHITKCSHHIRQRTEPDESADGSCSSGLSGTSSQRRWTRLEQAMTAKEEVRRNYHFQRK